MNVREIIGALVGGFTKAAVIMIVALFVLLILVRGCVAFLEAHEPIDVRINENDRTIGGLNYPGDSDPLLDTYLYLDIYSGAEPTIADTIRPATDEEMTSYIKCLDYNTELFQQMDDTDDERIAQLDAQLRDCWKLTP